MSEAISMLAQEKGIAEETLLQLSDVVTATYFTTHERARGGWEALG